MSVRKSEIDFGMEIFDQFVFADSVLEEEKLEIVLAAIALGKERARQLVEEFGVQKPGGLLKHLGIQIKREKEKKTLSENYVKFAEYYAKSGIIYLNTEAIKTLQEKMQSELVEDIILCHELYHYFEVSRWGMTSERFMKRVKMFGVIPVKRKLLPAAEIAANSFTKAYLSLDFNPQIIEEIYFGGVEKFCHGFPLVSDRTL